MTTNGTRTLISERSKVVPEVSQNWVNKNIAARILRVSPHTLKIYRKRHWIQGVHFQYLNSRTIRYHEGLLREWFANISELEGLSTSN